MRFFWRTLQVAGLGLLCSGVGAQALPAPGKAPARKTAPAVKPAPVIPPAPVAVPEPAASQPEVEMGAAPAMDAAQPSPVVRNGPDPACALAESVHNLTLPAVGASREIRFGQAGQRCLQAASTSAAWVNVVISRQSGALRVAVAPNPTTQARQAEIQVVHNNDSAVVWVSQEGAPAPVAPAPVAVPAAAAPAPAEAPASPQAPQAAAPSALSSTPSTSTPAAAEPVAPAASSSAAQPERDGGPAPAGDSAPKKLGAL